MSSPCCATPKLKRNAFSSTLFPEASFSPHFFSPSYSLLLLKSVGFKFCLLFPLLVLLDDGPDYSVTLVSILHRKTPSKRIFMWDQLGLSDLEYSFSFVTNSLNSCCLSSLPSKLLFRSSGLYLDLSSSSVGTTQYVSAGPPTLMIVPL